MDAMDKIDLHTHSKVSDGQYAPTELLQRARAEGLETLALTDHDTTGGLIEAIGAARDLGMEFIPGIEMSAFVGDHEFHLLGHFIDPRDEALSRFIDVVRGARVVRVRRMVERLRALGLGLTFEEVAAFAEGDSLGRTHLAQALLARGYVEDFQDAFRRYIGSGKPGFVEPMKVPADQAIALLHGAGGTVTLAHGLAYGVTRAEIAQLEAEGLDGLEVDHPSHDDAMRRALTAWAAEFDLIQTAGSDFHGERIIPERRLCECAMPRSALEALRARRGGRTV
ncbi:MAG: PHP domain-containing protein [Myxococcales bacterium]|jgi:predicted metal-dependent phosphoesterase TrpH|nr:PHP domain-containing protein [Myxococcales bacterium]